MRQYTALDGREHLRLPIPALGHRDNFTRAYYSASGRFILSGSSEEQLIRYARALSRQTLGATSRVHPIL